MCEGKIDRLFRMNCYNSESKQRKAIRSVKVIIECDQLPEYLTVYEVSVRRMEENIIRVKNNNKLSYFEAKGWIKENVCARTLSVVW